MKKAIEIMAVIIGVCVVILVVINLFFGVRAYGLPITEEVPITIEEMKPFDAEEIYNHPLFEEYGSSYREDMINDECSIIYEYPSNFTNYYTYIEKVPEEIEKVLEGAKTHGDNANVTDYISEDNTMTIRVAIDEAETPDFYIEEGILDFTKTVTNLQDVTLIKYSAIYEENSIDVYFAMLSHDTAKVSSFEALADEVISTMWVDTYITGDSGCLWGYTDDNSFDFEFELPGDVEEYGVINMDIFPYEMQKAFAQISIDDFVETADEDGGTGLWLSWDEMMAIRMSAMEVDDNDFEGGERNLSFRRHSFEGEPLTIAYETIQHGIRVNIDFVFLYISDEEKEYCDALSEAIIDTVEITPYSSAVNAIPEFKSNEKNSSSGSSRAMSFVSLTNVLIFIVVFKAIFKAVKGKKNRSETAQYYREKSKEVFRDLDKDYNNNDKDIEMDYDHCNTSTTQTGVYYNTPLPQEYNIDYSNYAYGISMTKEDKRKKQEQYKSLLEGGMMERDEYNDKMRELDKLYKGK